MTDSFKPGKDNYRISNLQQISGLSDIMSADTARKYKTDKDTVYQPSHKPYSKGKTRKYRILPLVILGDIIFALLILLGIAIWSIPAFMSKQVIEESTVIPLLIYLFAIFLSSYMVSYIIKSKSFLPNFLLLLTFILYMVFVSGYKNIVITGLLLKSLYSLITAIAAFLLVKLLHKNKRRKRSY